MFTVLDKTSQQQQYNGKWAEYLNKTARNIV